MPNQKKRDVTVLVEEVFSREKKSTVEQSVHPKPSIAKTTKRKHSKPEEQTVRESGVVKNKFAEQVYPEITGVPTRFSTSSLNQKLG